MSESSEQGVDSLPMKPAPQPEQPSPREAPPLDAPAPPPLTER